MVESMKASGRQTICMEKVCTLGKTEEGTKDFTKRIRSTDSGFTTGPMGEDTKAIG